MESKALDRIFLLIASLSGGLAVALGAFGAHALQDRVTAERLVTWETANRYHFYHTLALLAVAWAVTRLPESGLPVSAGWLMLVGTLIFSGSLYLLVLSGRGWLGAITPIGGLALIAGWLCLALAAWSAR
ncbi:MAG: DUF423 domain-containing protein [Caldilineae bacterium]|nr:DUF423 domain-containing protein [Chloroflexota bacterium]MCB9175948.1 DUF423 domain-containing protein [Caldilineae bacterium]